jgi:2,3-bisphosphoglycerate-dependent phosphoglycerate mutase
MTGLLVLLRHGQSTWNELNLFTGWHDVELTAKGEREATQAGQTLKLAGISFDLVFTSLLTRAIETNRLALAALGQSQVEVRENWLLNERHYGALQGLDKKATTEKYGPEQTNLWRRSYDIAPPPVELTSPEHPRNDSRYQHIAATSLPSTECLKDVVARVVPFFNTQVMPALKANKNVLITAHGNSLRALVMHLEKMSPEQIAEFNIPTGVPRKYQFDSEMTVATVAYLGDPLEIAKAGDRITLAKGATLIKQGDPGKEAFIILSGKATVKRSGKKVATLGTGSVVGELSLLDHGPRTATVTCDTECQLLVISRGNFLRVTDKVPALTHKLLGSLSLRIRDLDRAYFG